MPVAESLVFVVLSIAPIQDSALYPPGTVRIEYRSAYDGGADWALFTPGAPDKRTVVYLHGSFAHADQIYTRQDIRDFWLTRIRAGGHPLLAVNMRDTSYMSPAATRDLTDLLDHCAKAFGCRSYLLLGGSGGASSAMAYAVMHPEKIGGVVAMGMCDIFARLGFARRSSNPVLQKLARVTAEAYGGTPEEKPELYRERSVLAHPDRLAMPVVLTMGEKDALIPVAETRKIAEALKGHPNFTYVEIPGGDHDSALWVDIDLDTLAVKSPAPPLPTVNAERVEFISAFDGRRDWYLVVPGQPDQPCCINIHGHGSAGDQLWTRLDIRPNLDAAVRKGITVLSPNLRGNAWMSPAAAADLAQIIAAERRRRVWTKTIVVAGSMGGSSALAFAALRPEFVDGVVALGAATDVARYQAWCLAPDSPPRTAAIRKAIAEAIEAAYESADKTPHSASANAVRLAMPIVLVHGELDETIPVEEARDLAAKMKKNPNFVYREIPDGGHDAPLAHWAESLETLIRMMP